MRLTAKLSLLLLGLALAVLGSTLLPLYVTETRHLVEQVEARQLADLHQFARVCGDSLAAGDEATRLGYLKTFILFSEPGTVAYAMLADASGTVLLHSDFLHDERSLQGQAVSGPAFGRAMNSIEGLRQGLSTPSGVLDLLSGPIYAETDGVRKRAATAFIAYDRAAMEAALRRTQRESLSRVLQAALPGLSLGLLLALVFGRALTRPIQRLGEGARRVGEGKLDTRIAMEREDELGDLARDFNAMAQRLAELDELKESFLAQITHDLRNPLASLMAYLDVIQKGALGKVEEKQLEALRTMSVNADFLNNLIGDILDITKMEAGKMAFKPVPIDAAALAGSVVESMKARAAEYGVTLDGAGVSPGVKVVADEQALRRVLMNLVSNALKFTPKGGRVSIALASRDGLDRISVADSGIGIPADKMHTLFQKFSQVEETKNKVREARGTGLGLVICKQIVEAHGGTIGVESVYHKGTTFSFTLPTQPAAQPAAA